MKFTEVSRPTVLKVSEPDLPDLRLDAVLRVIYFCDSWRR